MSDQVQLEAAVAGYQYRATRGGTWARGVSAVEIGVRRSWMALRGSATHVALGLGFDIPMRAAGADGRDREAIAAQPSLVVAHDFARLHGLQLLSNVILDVPVQRSADPASVSAHFAVILPVDAVRLLSEMSWMPDERPGDERRYVFITRGWSSQYRED